MLLPAHVRTFLPVVIARSQAGKEGICICHSDKRRLFPSHQAHLALYRQKTLLCICGIFYQGTEEGEITMLISAGLPSQIQILCVFFECFIATMRRRLNVLSSAVFWYFSSGIISELNEWYWCDPTRFLGFVSKIITLKLGATED